MYMTIVSSKVVPMKESDMEWVRSYLSGDAATNSDTLAQANTWLVCLVNWSGTDTVEVYEAVDGVACSPDSGGFDIAETLKEAVAMLETEGFPIDCFDPSALDESEL